MKYVLTLSVIIFTILITSCKETKKTIETPSYQVYSGKYEIKSINGKELARKLNFIVDASENKISGKTGCNSYFGTYTVINNNEIKIGPLASTEMYCEEHVMKVEREIFKAYNDSKTFSFDNNMLTLFAEDGALLVRAYKLNK